MRNAIACVGCRAAKRQCIHNDRPPCKRCKNRKEQCVFPGPGTSALHRIRKARNVVIRRHSNSLSTGLSQGVVDGKITGKNSCDVSGAQINLSSYDLNGVNPYELFTDEVNNSYLRCSYKWSFHHIPSLLVEVRKNRVDPGVMWSILALAIRFTNDVPAPFKTPLEASNAFATHAKSIVLPSVEQPTLSRIQALLMITGHSWGAGEARQAWIYLGMAIRMAQMLGLFEESHDLYQDERHFVEAEERRRTAWTCFLMDNLLSGGKRRVRSLSANDMQIQLPCDIDNFNFGEAVKCERLDGSTPQVPISSPIGRLGIVSYSMRVAEIWGKVAKWACSPAVEAELPWDASSQFQQIQNSILRWKESLPTRLHLSITSLHAHSASNQGQAYAYMHAIALMAGMFLHRAYLSPAGSQSKHQTISVLDQQWRQWQEKSRRELLDITEQTCDLFEEAKEFGLYFQRGLVPWNGYTVYTATGIMLYFYHFPCEADNEALRRYQDRVVKGCAFLKDMKNSWPMADSWRETIKRMQIFYSTIRTNGESGVSATERKEMHDAVVDYGALHHSPITTSDAHIIPKATHKIPPDTTRSISQPPDLMNASTTVQQVEPEYDLHFTDFDMDIFNTSFSISNTDFENVIFNSTQDFWAQFPGESNMAFS